MPEGNGLACGICSDLLTLSLITGNRSRGRELFSCLDSDHSWPNRELPFAAPALARTSPTPSQNPDKHHDHYDEPYPHPPPESPRYVDCALRAKSLLRLWKPRSLFGNVTPILIFHHFLPNPAQVAANAGVLSAQPRIKAFCQSTPAIVRLFIFGLRLMQTGAPS